MSSYPKLIAALLLSYLVTACSSGGDFSAPLIGVNITGTVHYEDKLYGPSGFTGSTNMKAVRHAKVELVGDGGVVAHSSTDESGGYTLSGIGRNLYVRVLAQTDGTGAAHTVEVVNANAPSQIYAIPSARLSDGESTVDFDITLAAAGAVAGVFNILDVYQSAGEFTYSNNQGQTGLPPLQVRWAECSSNGTYTSNYGGYIVIALLGLHAGCPSFTVDTDEYDDDVMWHEYGHYLEFAYGTDDNPGYSHALSDLNQDLRLAWSEGWGDFLSGRVKEWLLQTHPERLSIDTALIPSVGSFATSWYVDTRGTTAFSYDFRNGTFQGTQLLYASNEGSVAKILWGINDDAVMDFSTIWGVFANQLPGMTANLESVWDGWLARYSPSTTDKSTMRAILNDRAVYYQDDSSEPDNTLATAKALRKEPAFYTLFSNDGQSEDFDLVPFTVTNGSTYLIETYGLHNGADTYLRILDNSGNQVLANDDYYENDTSLSPAPSTSPNDTCRFSSRVLFAPSVVSPQTFYAEITSSPYRLPGAGRFGDYQLAITETTSQPPSYHCP